MRKILVAGAIAAVVGGIVVLRSPLRTPIPPPSADVATIKPKLDKLKPVERDLVIGYLLRQRHEVVSTFMRDDASFDARTFKDAIANQKEFLAREGYAEPSYFLKRALGDALMKPLRDATDGELHSRKLSSRREIFNIPQGYNTYYGDSKVSEQDKPILVTTYRVRNLTNRAIAKVEGVVEIRAARYDKGKTLGMLNSCFLKVESLAPHASQTQSCSNVNAGYTPGDQQFFNTDPADLHVVWYPRRVEFEDGTVLEYNDIRPPAGKIWGVYDVADRS